MRQGKTGSAICSLCHSGCKAGFSPAELVFGHNVRGPLKVLQEQLVCSSPPKTNVTDFVLACRERLQRTVRLAKEALSLSQVNMKERFDKKTVK